MPTEEESKKVLKYQILQSRLNALAKQRDFIVSKILEISESLKSVEEIKQDDQIIFSLGSNTYGYGKLTSDKFLVDIGADVVLEKNKEETKEILTKRKIELEEALKEIENEIVSTANEIEKLAYGEEK